MAHFRGNRSASGGPGDEPRWTGAAKDGVGTAHSMGGRVWFTIGQGILTEVYYPTIDRPQMRDLEFLFAMETDCFWKKRGIWTTRSNESCLRRDIESAGTILRGVSLS